MNIESFLLCDAANDSRGKLNVLGAFNSILTKKIPVVKLSSSLACRLRFESEEVGDHHFKVLIVDMDGRNLISPIEGKMNVKIQADQIFTVVNIILNFQNLKLEQFGNYRVQLEYDGEDFASLPFCVVKQPS